MNNSYKLKAPFQVTITVLSGSVYIYFEVILLNRRPMNGTYKLFSSQTYGFNDIVKLR